MGASRKIPRYDAEVFFDTERIFGCNISWDEKDILISSDRSGVFNCYSISTETREIIQLTHSETESYFSVGWIPNSHSFIYTADQSGDERNHLYVQDRDGTIIDLTPGTDLKASFLGWSSDDQYFWVITNE